ncbi:ankyrin repeat domain-containing protein [Candidatus Riflebacteria bacterium]
MQKTIVSLFFILFLSLLSPGIVSSGEIHEAAKSGDIKKLKAELDKDPGLLYAQCEQGKTPLHWATGKGQLQVIRILLDEYKVDINVRNKNQGTPLHVAASQAQPEAARVLIRHGASVNAQAGDGATPLHYASFKGRKRGHIETARILLENRADPNIRNYNGATPLLMAEYRGNREIIELLKNYGAKKGKGAFSGTARPGSSGRAGLNAYLKKFDINGDGVLDDSEKEQIRNRMGQRTGDSSGQNFIQIRRKLMLQRFDLNGDGRLDREEREKVMEQRRNRFGGQNRRGRW